MNDKERVKLKQIFDLNHPSVILDELSILCKQNALMKGNDESSLDKCASEICELMAYRLEELQR